MAAVAADEIGRAHRLARTAAVFQNRSHARVVPRQIGERDIPLDRNVGGAQLFDQKPLVIVLREHQDEGIGAEARAHIAEVGAGALASALAHADGPHLHALCHSVVAKPELSI